MEKVILTKEQAEKIEPWKHKEERRNTLLKLRADRTLHNSRCLYELSLDEVARALYIGYEVEPDFESGDWVVFDNKVYVYDFEQEEDDVYNDAGAYISGYTDGVPSRSFSRVVKFSELRHATQEEIAEEIERRWWKKHGRDVWELRKGDILRRREGKMVEYVAKAQGEEVWFEYRGRPNTLDFARKYFCVACFVEKRLDVKTNE